MFNSTLASQNAIEKSGLIHRVYLSEPELRNPDLSVVLVHGRAGNAEVPWTFTRALSSAIGTDATLKRPVVVAPQAPHPDPLGGFSWWSIEEGVKIEPDKPRPATTREQLMPALEQLYHFVNALPELYGAKSGKIALVGFSQGAAMIGSLSLLYPELFSGVALLAGFIPKLVYEEGWQSLTSEFTPPKGSRLPRYYVSHGRDDKVVPYDRAEKVVHVLSSLGAEVTFHLEDVGHKLGTAGMRGLASWFSELLRGDIEDSGLIEGSE